MQLNKKKTKVILFNRARNYDFMPACNIEESENLQVVEELKLLGVMVSSDLSWTTHCDYMSKKAFARLWMLRRLKPLGATVVELLEVYQTQVRSVLEFAVAAWNYGLTKNQTNQIERVQKAAFAIILGKDYINYNNALTKLKMKSLSERRYDLCLKFAQKSLKHDKYANWFCESSSKTVNTRSSKPELKPVQARLKRFEKSPLSYLTGLLNDQ